MEISPFTCIHFLALLTDSISRISVIIVAQSVLVLPDGIIDIIILTAIELLGLIEILDLELLLRFVPLFLFLLVLVFFTLHDRLGRVDVAQVVQTRRAFVVHPRHTRLVLY